MKLTKKIFIISVFDLLLTLFLKNSMTISFILLVSNLLKLIFVIVEYKNLDNQFVIFLISIIIWYNIGMIINIFLNKVSYDNSQKILTFISLSVLCYLIGIKLGSKIKSFKIKKNIYLEYSDFFRLILTLIFISFFSSIIFNYRIILGILGRSYFSNRISFRFGRGYFALIATMHSFLVPIYLFIKQRRYNNISNIDLLFAVWSFALLSVSLNRGPILTQIIFYIILFSYNRKVKYYKYMFISIILLVFLGYLIPQIRGQQKSIYFSIIDELSVHTWNLSRYINLTSVTGFFFFLPYKKTFSIILPGHQDDFVLWLKKFNIIDVDVGGASMSLIGEGYLEFGTIGIIINFIFLGIIISYLFNHRKKNMRSLILYLYMLTRIESIIQFGFTKILLTIIFYYFLLSLINQPYSILKRLSNKICNT